jgi:hypothetical protein
MMKDSDANRFERIKEARLYFQFENSEKRDAARALLNKLRDEGGEEDELFRYFKECKNDSARPNVGLEIIFFRTIPQLEERVEAILAEHGNMPKEEYETIDGQPVPEKTKINQ